MMLNTESGLFCDLPKKGSKPGYYWGASKTAIFGTFLNFFYDFLKTLTKVLRNLVNSVKRFNF
jgi:hypothetical protein